MQLLESLRRPLQLLPNGTLQLDLVAEPWVASATQLKQAQQEVQVQLIASGVFLDDTDIVHIVEGPRWRSPAPRQRKAR